MLADRPTDAPLTGYRSSSPMRLAILTSHPIQYYAPWFRHLAIRFDLEVLYAHRQDPAGQAAAGFGVAFDWDVPLLDGYRYRWLKNVSRRPGLQRFGGCDTPELFDLIRPKNYDALLVLGWNRKSFVQGIRAAWRHKVPVLMRGDSQLGTARSRIKRALKYLPYRWFLPRIDAHLYVGKRNRDYLRHYGVREEQLFFSPHFVDNDFFAARSQEARDSGRAAAIRENFNIPPDGFVALFVGKFLQKKRVDDFIAASLSAADKRTNFHAVLIGDGLMRARLEELARAHPRIHFAGFRNQSELPDFYAAADVLVLPSDAEETWGLVVNEAMACGVPAIVSDAVGCTPDLIESELTGVIYSFGDIEALSDQLAGFRDSDTESLRRKSVEYSISKATEGLELAITALLGQRAI
ncbi:MAG: glycosyltransferase family 4 protein [Chthoniobacterales bacterium]